MTFVDVVVDDLDVHLTSEVFAGVQDDANGTEATHHVSLDNTIDITHELHRMVLRSRHASWQSSDGAVNDILANDRTGPAAARAHVIAHQNQGIATGRWIHPEHSGS